MDAPLQCCRWVTVCAIFVAFIVSHARANATIAAGPGVVRPQPNLVFVLVDDWGFADVGFRNPKVYTPTFDKLAQNGLLLDRHYVFKYCSPSRASFLSGRWPHHAHQWNNDNGDELLGTNINFTMLPKKLKQAGYHTHMVGKWHQGFFTPGHLPINRGFDTSSGFLTGGEDHMTQKHGCVVDFWRNRAPDPRNGTYDAWTYRDDVKRIVSEHDPADPFFLYLALHNVHTPWEAPKDWIDKYPKNSTCSSRRTYQAMTSVADNVTGTLVELLQAKGMWDNTLLIVSADNGGAPCGGSNYPLYGCKGTFFEGGVRSLAFANGGLLPANRRGKKAEAFMHIADWYTTFCTLAGVDPADSGPGKFGVDGLNVWPIITGASSQTPHKEIVLGFNFSESHPNQGALIAGNYKLIVGKQSAGCDSLMYSPLDYPCSKGPSSGHDCDPHCLFDIVNDPRETKDLSRSEPTKLKELLARYNAYSTEPRYMQDQGVHCQTGCMPTDPKACDFMRAHGSYWQPWRGLNSSTGSS